MRIANENARKFVDDCISFRGSNLFGEIKRLGLYVVYSYGYHFPIYAKINGFWYGNKDKYSVSTSKHQSQACPSGEVIYVGLTEIKDLIEGKRNGL